LQTGIDPVEETDGAAGKPDGGAGGQRQQQPVARFAPLLTCKQRCQVDVQRGSDHEAE
jgi:hypothetical protein